MSCAQIKVVNGGSGNPAMVSIPGYLSNKGTKLVLCLLIRLLTLPRLVVLDPSLMVDIYWPIPTSYEVRTVLRCALALKPTRCLLFFINRSLDQNLTEGNRISVASNLNPKTFEDNKRLSLP